MDSDQTADGLESAIEEAVKALCFEVTAELTEACPVDTGHARRNFVPSVGEPHEGVDDGAAQAAGRVGVLTYELGDGDLFVTNNAPYIGMLVIGWSHQAPPGWDIAAVERAVAAVQQMSGVSLEIGSPRGLAVIGAMAAGNLAAAYSPLGDDQ